jgi:hypothetical protein
MNREKIRVKIKEIIEEYIKELKNGQDRNRTESNIIEFIEAERRKNL